MNHSAHATTVSTSEAEQLLSALFELGDLIEHRVIETWEQDGQKRGQVRGRKWIANGQESEETWVWLRRLNEQGANAFFGVCPRARRGGKKEDVQRVRTLWADIDNCSAKEALERCRKIGLPEPSVVVNSGNGVHLYWGLDSPVEITRDEDRDQIESLLKRVYADLDGGDHVQDLSRLLRLPGFLNVKNKRNGAKPVPCTLINCDRNRRYPLSAFARWDMPNLNSQDRHTPMRSDVEDRSKRDYALLCDLVRSGTTEEEAWAQVKDTSKFASRERDYFQQTWDAASAEVEQNGRVKRREEIEAVDLSHDCSLAPGTPRETPSGKIVVPVSVAVAGKIVDRLTLTDSAHGRREVVKALARVAPDTEHDQIEAAIGSVLAQSAERLERQRAARQRGPTVASIVGQKIPALFRLAYRSEKGMWSEARGCEVTRREFIEFTPSWLLSECEHAINCPRNEQGQVERLRLLRSIEAELKILWSTLLHKMPAARDVELGATSAAAKKLREAMRILWTISRLQIAVEVGAQHVPARASLISQVKKQAALYLDRRPDTPPKRTGWQEIKVSYPAWWRPYTDERGQVKVALAMRWELTASIGVNLPNVNDQETLTSEGGKAGVVWVTPAMSSVTRRGVTRVSVLSPSFTDELLDSLEEWEEDEVSATEKQHSVT